MPDNTKPKHYVSQQDMKQILDLALKNQLQEEKTSKNKIDLKHIQDAAAEMGIARSDITDAWQVYQGKKAKKGAAIIVSGVTVVLIIAIAAVVWWINKPKIFQGKVAAVFTHKLTVNNKPIKKASRFGLNQNMIYLYFTWSDIAKDEEYQVNYYWKGPKGEIIFTENYLLKMKSIPYYSWTNYSPKASDPIGKWTIEVKINEKNIGSYSFQMQDKLPAHVLDMEISTHYKGESNIFYNTKKDKTPPTKPVTQIKAGQRVYCFAKWFNIGGTHTVKWRWINQAQETVSLETIEFTTGTSGWGETGQGKTATYNTWDPITLSQPGTYQTFVFIDDYFVKKLSIEVLPASP